MKEFIKEIGNFKIKSDECLEKEGFLPVFKRWVETYNKIVEEIDRGAVKDEASINDLRQAGFRLRSMRKIAIAEGVIGKDEFPEIEYPNPTAVVNEERVNRLTNKLHSLEKALAAKQKANEKFVNSFPKQVLDFVKSEEARISSEIDAIKKELGKSHLPAPQKSIIDEIEGFKCGEEFMSNVISIEKLEDWISRYNEVSKSVSGDQYERVYQAGCKLKSMQKIVMAETGKTISPVVLPTKPEKETRNNRAGQESIIDKINAIQKEIEDELKRVNNLASKLSDLLPGLTKLKNEIKEKNKGGKI